MPVNGSVNSEQFHLPLTLDMDGCGWSRTHLCDSLSLSRTHTCCFATLSFSPSHIQFEASVCALVQVWRARKEKKTFQRQALPLFRFPAAFWAPQQIFFFTPIMQLFPLIAPSSLVISQWLNEISCSSPFTRKYKKQYTYTGLFSCDHNAKQFCCFSFFRPWSWSVTWMC